MCASAPQATSPSCASRFSLPPWSSWSRAFSVPPGRRLEALPASSWAVPGSWGGSSEDAPPRLWSLTAADAAEALRARGTEHRLRCAVQLCALRATGHFVVDYRRAPPEAVNHLAQQLGLEPVLALPDPIRPATETAQLQRIRRYLSWHEFNHAAEQRLRARLQERAFEDMLPGPLLALAEDLLRAARIVLPATSTLGRLVASVIAHAVQDLFERIAAGLPDRLRDAIEDLVDVPEGEHRSPLAHSRPRNAVRNSSRPPRRSKKLKKQRPRSGRAASAGSYPARESTRFIRVPAWRLRG